MVSGVHRFLVVIEQGRRNYSAYAPDLPGCVATGRTRDGVARRMHEAIQMHLEGMIEDGVPIPASTSQAEYMAVRT